MLKGEKLTEFSIEVLRNWISKGYQYIRYQQKQDNHAILSPLKVDDLGHEKHSEEYYNLPITDEQCLEMASGIPEFKFLTTNI
jgi:hypothetical protein